MLCEVLLEFEQPILHVSCNVNISVFHWPKLILVTVTSCPQVSANKW